MATLTELQTWKTALETARFTGKRVVEIANVGRTEYKSDAEMAGAIDEINRQIAALSTPKCPTAFRFSTSKGY